MAEFARNALDDAARSPSAVPRAEIARQLAAIRSDFGKIGSNINQLAKVANETKLIDTGELKAEFAALVVARAALSAALADLQR